jgi:hypothetical protein
MQHDPMQVLDEGGLVLIGEGTRVSGFAPELGFTGGQPVRFQLHWLAMIVLADQHKVSVISYQYLVVFVPVP